MHYTHIIAKMVWVANNRDAQIISVAPSYSTITSTVISKLFIIIAV